MEEMLKEVESGKLEKEHSKQRERENFMRSIPTKADYWVGNQIEPDLHAFWQKQAAEKWEWYGSPISVDQMIRNQSEEKEFDLKQHNEEAEFMKDLQVRINKLYEEYKEKEGEE
jgi:CRISPR/Cas system endoribonuclease Cas6 (RAMP superfamily)